MYKRTPHRQLKNRTIKRRVSAHQFLPKRLGNRQKMPPTGYDAIRAHGVALAKLKRSPQLLDTILANLAKKRLQQTS